MTAQIELRIGDPAEFSQLASQVMGIPLDSWRTYVQEEVTGTNVPFFLVTETDQFEDPWFTLDFDPIKGNYKRIALNQPDHVVESKSDSSNVASFSSVTFFEGPAVEDLFRKIVDGIAASL